MRAFRFAPALLALALILGSSAVAGAGTITGRVFTAESADSVAKGARSSSSSRRRRPDEPCQGADRRGRALPLHRRLARHIDRLRAPDLAARAGFPQRSDPVRARTGESTTASSSPTKRRMGGLSRRASPYAPDAPPRGVALRPQSGPCHSDRALDRPGLRAAGDHGPAAQGTRRVTETPAAVRTLVRDIASLDIRHEDGVIGEEEYRKVREGLLTRLRSLTRGLPG